MSFDTIELAKALIAAPSVSKDSNAEVSDLLEERFNDLGFEVERLEYVDANNELKVSLVAKKGSGTGGLAFFSHTDTVPGQEEDWAPWSPVVENGHLIGRGSCDMKGPLAATIAAAVQADASQLKRPVYVVACADEEVGGGGAKQVAAESVMLNNSGPDYGVIAEPTGMIPVYAHKGGGTIKVTARGVAAHSSTDKGISANFLIAPFLVEMAEFAKQLLTDESFRNYEFSPPTPGFNMVLNDNGCRPNVTAAKTVATVGLRSMPNDRSKDIIAMVSAKAEKYGFEVESRWQGPFYTPPDAAVVKAACQATGEAAPQTVPYGTDGFFLQDTAELVVLGPGDIAQAHTVGEWVEVEQLTRAVDVYHQMIRHLCIEA